MKFKKAFIPLLLTTVMLAGCGSKDKNKSEIIKNDFNGEFNDKEKCL